MTLYGRRNSIFFKLILCFKHKKGEEMNVELFTKVLSEILSEKHGVNITIKAERRTDDRKKVILRRDTCERAVR